MIITITQSTSEPEYLQIYSSIVRSSFAGDLPADMRLPAKKRLAKDLRLKPRVVSRAYELLEDDGMIKISGGKIVIRKDVLENKERYLNLWRSEAMRLISKGKAGGIEVQKMISEFRYLAETGLKVK